MPSVDDRVVRMEFDNAAFERKLATTMQSLSQLDKALKFTGGSKGLADVNQTVSKMDFRTISDGIENVSRGFISLSTVAITTLSNITNRAIAAGTQIAKSLTLAPIMDGFREYETNMTSIQTILANTASKGTTLDDVTAALDKLNQYSDQTIYNFGQMARNIGTFTAAGVDLQTSVDSIKGIANLAAMSGSTSEQAATAMYQLSQAIAAGSVKLMDWNSVVNAGMGGEAFKSALFETQKAMGNVLNVPLGQTFKEWEDAGNSFRETLQDGWITADVLTTTLQAFTGDMTEEMLLQKGFSEDQALNILKTAAIAKAAATEVKTFTQLMATTKEAIGTGWADTFRLIIGNFTEAKSLWTSVSNSVSGFINNMAEARNEMFSVWRFVGGREDLIAGLKASFSALGEVLGTLKDAFRYVFPATTGLQLAEFTEGFRKFAEALKPSADTLLKLDSIFVGFFSVLSIGWTVIKEGIRFLYNLAKSIADAFGGGATDTLVKFGDTLTNLKTYLVDGGKIRAFFDGLTKAVQAPIKFIKAFAQSIGDIFSLWDAPSGEQVSETVGRIGDRFQFLKDMLANAGDMWGPFGRALDKIVDILENVWTAISNWFKELGQRLSNVMKEGDFDALLDFINVGLLGGIAALLAKFVKDGFSFDIGSGFLEKVGKSFEALTGYLQAMQMNVKANALLKIAGAIAVLTASVLVLSMIDSEALTRALTAMAVGFGQLLGAFSVLTKIVSDPKAAASFTLTATGLVVLSGAMLVMALAAKIMASMDWEEIARGFVGVTGLIAGLILASKGLQNSTGMIRAGIAMGFLAVGLVIMAGAMKIFATMSWEEMTKGLVGVAGGMGAFVQAMRLLPDNKDMVEAGASLILVAVGMNILAGAVAIFSAMSWEEMAQGLVGVTAALAAFVGAVNLLPDEAKMVSAGAGMLLAAVAMNILGGAMKIFASMSWEEMGRGLATMAGALLILGVAMYAMGQVGPLGAVAIMAAAGAMVVIASVIKAMSKLSWDQVIHALEALAVALGGIALISVILMPATLAITALGVAITFLGVGLMMIGAGIYLFAKSMELVVRAGDAGAKAMTGLLKTLAMAIPILMKEFAIGIVDMIKVFTDAAPVIAKSIGVLLEQLIDTAIRLLPKLSILISETIDYILILLREKGPDMIKTGIFLIVQLLKGIRDKIEKITEVVADILINFLKAFEEKIPEVAEQLANTIITMWTSAAYEVGRVAGTLLVGIGKAFMKGLIDGVDSQTGGLMSRIISIPGKIIGWIGDVVTTLWQKGVDIIQGFVNGYISTIEGVWNFFRELPGKIAEAVGDTLGWLLQKGMDIVQGLWNGIKAMFESVKDWFNNIGSRLVSAIHSPLEILKDVGLKIIEGLVDGIKSGFGLVKDALGSLTDKLTSWKGPPKRDEKLLYGAGQLIMTGLHQGLKDGFPKIKTLLSDFNPSDDLNPDMAKNMSKTLSGVADKMSILSEFTPTITPVLDLSDVRKGASGIKGLLDGNTIGSNLSFNQAQIVIKDSKKSIDGGDSDSDRTKAGVSFVQNIHAPDRLSASDIYRQTRNQITLAKEELKIP